ncbi:hypothetical protein AMS68_005444 [Peltaster fructicola]|uniref:Uncharacterized protein n=1 Tax=Peltaster fructicola TaxID=286661 RepID=A0A6H0XYV5_9PEZI|nr:hypothetical protein AMS68_005444 [Peltaster fructicola]
MVGGEGYRTDFLRSSPIDGTHATGTGETASFGTIEEESSSGSDQYEPKPMFQFSPSIRQPRSPLPAHMKRGTLSYTISPIRQLRTKKSTQSLRRHAASPMRSNSQRTRSSVSRSNTSASTETIQVLMTPDQRPSYVAPHLPSGAYAQRVHDTPTRQPNQSQPGLLGSPYSYQPRDNALNVDTSMSARRVTTFSSLMEKAGLRREDLYSDSSH